MAKGEEKADAGDDECISLHAPAAFKIHGESLAAIMADMKAAREMHRVSLETFHKLDPNLVTQDIQSYHDLVIVRVHQDKYVDARAAVQVTMPEGCVLIPMPAPEAGTIPLTPAPVTGANSVKAPGIVPLTPAGGLLGADAKDCMLCFVCLLVWCRCLAKSNDIVILLVQNHIR